MKDARPSPQVSLLTIFWIFFRIACTSFGGFMVIISMVQDTVVERRKLLSHQDMLDGISLASILPGTMAVNVIAYVGYRLRGATGAFVSAVAAILPPFTLIVLLGTAYFRWGELPAVSKAFMGFVPAVTAIIVAAAWNMGRKSVLGFREAFLAIGAAAALSGIGGFFSTLGIVLVAAALGCWWFRESDIETEADPKSKPRTRNGSKFSMKINIAFLSLPASIAPFTAFEPGILLNILGTFAGMSLLLFGGHYVFIPVIQEIVVTGRGWVTHQEFVDAVAMGQITPGPLMVSAAFIGLKVAGFAGAVAATVGIFTPSAVLMVVCAGLFTRVKELTLVKAALRGIRPAVVGMIAAAAVVVGQTAAPVWTSAAIFLSALAALLYVRVEGMWVIPVAGAIGYLVY